jgi:hypothetical protein
VCGLHCYSCFLKIPFSIILLCMSVTFIWPHCLRLSD